GRYVRCALRSDRPKHLGSDFTARWALYACHLRRVQGYLRPRARNGKRPLDLITRWISRTAWSASEILQVVQVLTMSSGEPSAPAAWKSRSAPISPTDFAARGSLRWRLEDGSSISASGGRDAPRRMGKPFTPKNSPGTSPPRSGAVEADMRRSA